jgi:hypothetical protein
LELSLIHLDVLFFFIFFVSCEAGFFQSFLGGVVDFDSTGTPAARYDRGRINFLKVLFSLENRKQVRYVLVEKKRTRFCA